MWQKDAFFKLLCLSDLVARSSWDARVCGLILNTDTLKFCDHILFGGGVSTDTVVYMNLQKSPILIAIRKFMPKKRFTSLKVRICST